MRSHPLIQSGQEALGCAGRWGTPSVVHRLRVFLCLAPAKRQLLSISFNSIGLGWGGGHAAGPGALFRGGRCRLSSAEDYVLVFSGGFLGSALPPIRAAGGAAVPLSRPPHGSAGPVTLGALLLALAHLPSALRPTSSALK